MKANTKYVASDGVQYAMYPNPVMNITQSINGSYSHMGTNAIDDAQQDTGISNGYAPCDMICVATDYVNGNAMFWQSQRKVRTRKYGDCIISMMVIHDNTANAYIGMKIPQGSQLFSEGTMGMATGNHNHIEVAPCAFTRMYVLNSSGVYMMPNNVNPADVFFVDDTRIINGGGLNWAKIPTSSTSNNTNSSVVSFDEMEEENWAVRFKNDVPIIIHKDTSNGASIGTFVKGETQVYTHKGVGNGHRWIGWKETINGITYKCVCAISGSEIRGKDMWVELIDPSTLSSKEESKQENNNSQSNPNNNTTPPTTSNEEDEVAKAEQPDLEPLILKSQYGLTIKQSLVDKSLYGYKCHYIMTPEFIVIHNAGTNGNPSAENLNNAMKKDQEQKSWHFSVDENGAVQGLPINRNGWHAGDGGDGDGNRKGIAIEICRDMYDDGSNTYKLTKGISDERFDKAKDNGALLAAIILNKYGWDITHVKKHQDFMDKYCPHHILNDGWDRFLELVQSHLDEIQGKNIEKEPEVPKEEVKQDEEKIDTKQVNSLVSLLIKLIKKILGIFK